MYQVWIHPELQVNNRLGPYKYPSSVTSYAPSMNPFRAPSEQDVEALKEKIITTLEQVKDLENIIL